MADRFTRADFDEPGQSKIAELQNLVTDKVNAEHLEAEAIIQGYEGSPGIMPKKRLSVDFVTSTIAQLPQII